VHSKLFAEKQDGLRMINIIENWLKIAELNAEKAMNMDSFVEEFMNLQEQNATAVQPVIRNKPTKEQRDNMGVTTKRFMDEFVGTAKDLRGLFKIHTSTAVDSNLQQIICSKAKEWFEKSEGKLNLFGLNFTNEEQVSFWVNRTEETDKRLKKLKGGQ